MTQARFLEIMDQISTALLTFFGPIVAAMFVIALVQTVKEWLSKRAS